MRGLMESRCHAGAVCHCVTDIIIISLKQRCPGQGDTCSCLGHGSKSRLPYSKGLLPGFSALP